MPEYYRVKTSWRTSHKRRLLLDRLGPDAVLAVMDLWSYAAQAKPDGDLSGMSDAAIEAAADWCGEPGALVAAITEPQFELLDGGPGQRRLRDPRVIGGGSTCDDGGG